MLLLGEKRVELGKEKSEHRARIKSLEDRKETWDYCLLNYQEPSRQKSLNGTEQVSVANIADTGHWADCVTTCSLYPFGSSVPIT